VIVPLPVCAESTPSREIVHSNIAEKRNMNAPQNERGRVAPILGDVTSGQAACQLKRPINACPWMNFYNMEACMQVETAGYPAHGIF
jgi:hypothetical protein